MSDFGHSIIDTIPSNGLDWVMTAEEADERITKSRNILHDYLSLAVVGERPEPSDLVLIAHEIASLEAIASEHPNMAVALVRLVSEWVAFRERMRTTLH